MKTTWITLALFSLWMPAAIAAGDGDIMPNPLSGWTAGDVQVQESKEEMFGMAIPRKVVMREYYTKKDKRGIAIMIDTYDCVGATVIDTLHKDAEFRAKNKNKMSPVVVRGKNGMATYSKGGAADMVSIKVDSCSVVVVGGPNAPAGAIDSYMKALDFDKIKQAAH